MPGSQLCSVLFPLTEVPREDVGQLLIGSVPVMPPMLDLSTPFAVPSLLSFDYPSNSMGEVPTSGPLRGWTQLPLSTYYNMNRCTTRQYVSM